MFKKSEEQEWSRFRGALSKDRDDAATTPSTAETTETAGAAGSPAAGAATTPASPSFRPLASDVNVGVPASSRLSRSVNPDGIEVESLIGERTHFEGTLKCEGAIRLLGNVQGEIQSAGTIIVEDKAHVTARLTAAQVTIAGEVDGQIYCEGRVEIRPTGRVTGEISAGALIVQEGAYFDGSSRMAAPGSASGASSGTAGSSSGSASSGAAGSPVSSGASARGGGSAASSGSANLGAPSEAAASRA